MRDISWMEALCEEGRECLECGLRRSAGVDCLGEEQELLWRGSWAGTGARSSARAGCGR